MQLVRPIRSTRKVTFAFTAGAVFVGSIDYVIEAAAKSMVSCRYTADAAGTLSVRVFSPNSGSTCHLYGLSNEMIQDVLPTLTLNTPAGRSARHTGALNGYGRLIKQGEGTQIFGGINTLSAPADAKAGTLAFESGASVLSGVVVRAGATLAAPNGNVWLGGLEGAGTFSLVGIPRYPVTNLLFMTFFTNDATIGISPSKTYTHLMDFGTRANVAVINGVTFNKVSTQSGSVNGYGWANFPPNANPGNVPDPAHSVPAGSGAYDLLYNMDYGLSWPNPATMQLTGLTPGKRYEVRFYNRSWGWGGSRTQTVTFDPDGTGPITESITFNPDALNANFVGYRYTASSSTLAITVQSASSNQTYHIYGLSNEETSDATYAPVTVNIAQDSVFSGPITGAGGWTKTGVGTLTLTATNDATGALSVNAGALCVIGGGTATLGPVTVATGATLFGDGLVGGDVLVASNAWLHAGTPTACGLLAVGGNLTLAPGVCLTWRYDVAAADTFTVAGLLTFPTNGVVQASALGSGVFAPAKTVLFASPQAINGPATLTGWTVTGVNKATLTYSDDRTKIYFQSPRGTMLFLQ